MNIRSFKSLIILLIVSLVTMGISPACKFINGSAQVIEICTEDGEVKHITLAEAGLDQPDPAHNHEHSNAQKDCLFCFTSANGKALSAANHADAPALSSSYIVLSAGLIIPRALENLPFQPRGPPSLTV